ncbi:MAG: hypothetical protein ABH827_02375 [bacterium]
MLKTSLFKNLKFKTLFLSMFAFLFTVNVQTKTTVDLSSFYLPKNNTDSHEFKKFLDKFFKDTDVIEFFIKQAKPIRLYDTQRYHPNEYPEVMPAYQKHMLLVQQQAPARKQLWTKICQKYEFKIINTKSHCFTMQFKNFPKFVLKLPKEQWPLPFQNISRVFYNGDIENFIKNNKIESIKTVGKYLYLFPTAKQQLQEDGFDKKNIPLDEKYLNDNNFAVIANFIPNLPEDNKNSFPKEWTEDQIYDMGLLIAYGIGGTWDIKSNLFYLKEEDKFIIVDTEESGLDAWLIRPGEQKYRLENEWDRFSHCVERFRLANNKLSSKGKVEKQRKIANEVNGALNDLIEIPKTK